MAFYISGPKLLFETTEISTHPNSTQQESNYIYLYTTKFGTLIKIRLNRKFESTEFETMRVNCIYIMSSRASLRLSSRQSQFKYWNISPTLHACSLPVGQVTNLAALRWSILRFPACWSGDKPCSPALDHLEVPCLLVRWWTLQPCVGPFWGSLPVGQVMNLAALRWTILSWLILLLLWTLFTWFSCSRLLDQNIWLLLMTGVDDQWRV